MHPDVIVIGAGLVGAACADALSADGHRVHVVDQGPAGGGAMGAGMGHIVAMDDSEAQFALTRYSQRLWAARMHELPASVEHDGCGTLWVAADGGEMDAVRSKHAHYARHGLAAEILDEQQLVEEEPNLRPGLAGGLLVPNDSVIYAPCAAQWLIERAIERGARFTQSVRVAAVERGRMTLSDRSAMHAETIVVATGVSSLVPLPLRPRKGHLAITDRYPGFVRHQLVELGYLKSAHGHDNESVAFNVQPRATGQALIGSSRQYDVDDHAVEPAILSRMLRRAVEFLPGLAHLHIIRTWTGFRAATPDGLPVIGPVSPGVFVATGHEGLGITTSLGTARLIADQIAARPTGIPSEPYLPSRFIDG